MLYGKYLDMQIIRSFGEDHNTESNGGDGTKITVKNVSIR